MVKRFAKLAPAGAAVDLGHGETSGPGPTPTIANLVAPTITGVALSGRTLTAQPGTWSPAQDSLSYRWKRDDVFLPLPLGGSSTYVATAADVGKTITVEVTASKAGYLSRMVRSAGIFVSTADVSAGLFFDARPIQQPRAHTKKSFPHWWPYTIRSWANTPLERNDWYSTQMNNPDSSSYAHAKQNGGASRSRPQFRPPIPGTTAQWNLADRRFDIDTAIDYGHDGFFFDIIESWKSRGVDLANALRQARDENPTRYGNFTIIPMIDGNSPSAYSTTAKAGDFIRQFTDVGYWQDGVFMWAVWHPATSSNTGGIQTWRNIQTYLNNLGIPNKMFGCFNTTYSSTSNGPGAAGYEGLLFAEGPWGAGSADPANIAATAPSKVSEAAAAVGRGRIYVNPVRVQETRPDPNQGPWWDEAANTEAGVAQWLQVIGNNNAQWIQPVTWSDWTEDTAFAPGTHYGYGRLLLSAWFMYRWKMGAYPTILRDAVILSHRHHRLGVTVDYAGQTVSLPQRTNSPRTVARNRIEARVWLTAPAQVRIIDASGTVNYQAPAGMSAYTKELVNGIAPRAEIWRDGVKVTEIQSTQAIDPQPFRYDWTYWMFDNLHATTYQTRIPGPNPPYA